MPYQPKSVPDRKQLSFEIICWLAFIALWFLPLGYRALVTSDEGRYATISLNMMLNGDWVTPRLNGFLYFEKPALQYWMGALIFMVMGVSEFTARLWPAITGFLTVVFLAYTARKIWGKKESQYVTIVSGSMIWLVGNSHFLTLDMGTTFFLTASLCSFILSQQPQLGKPERNYWMLAVWATMALATLSKGLIGLLIPGATLVLYSLINWQWQFWKDLQWIKGLIVFLIICVPWFVLVSDRNPSFPHFFFIHEHVERFLTTEHKRTGPIYYFVPILLVGALPWTSWLVRLFINSVRDKGNANQLRIQRLLMIWSLFVFVFFSKSGSKLPSYILPMFPALALMLSWHLNRVDVKALKLHLILPAVLGIILVLLYPFVGHFLPHNESAAYLLPLYKSASLIGIILVVACIISFSFLKKQQHMLSSLSLGFASLLVFNVINFSYDNYGAKYKSTRDIAPLILPHMTAETKVFTIDYYDQTLPFYLRHNVILVDYRDEFSFGQEQQPELWIPNQTDFVKKWNNLSNAIAIMSAKTYQKYQTQGLPMNIIYQDYRRVVVSRL